MNSIPAHRGGRHVAVAAPHAPHAALLIDFDNVTLGIRSDLTKELRHLLDSDIFKGKVSVQRAYADWRRYPQYIVPLSESSIDLIFAPAFGTNKKNATDIRLAIDATELVFTRPEIGTFILLSGDSDFSSLVIKLKEYGKYVIGVGIRESASDILIQNCDEYYSYSDLAGLTRESDVPSTQRDPWELVVAAVEQMVANRDVMRADRLKQVMQQIDPNFDEKNAGFNRFSKFVQEAGGRGLIKVGKLENGQFEVAPAQGAGATPSGRPQGDREGAEPGRERSSERPRGDREGAEAGRARSGERARGGREGAESGRERSRGSARRDDRKRDAEPRQAEAPTPEATPPAPKADEAEPEKERGRRRRRGGRGRGKGAEEKPTAAPPPRDDQELTLAEAFHLLARALGELPAPVPHETVRGRMAALHGREDELLEPATFLRLLRQANDAEVADVRMIDEEHFEVSPHKTDLALQLRPAVTPTGTGETAAVARPATTLRYRSGTQPAKRSGGVPMVGVVKLDKDEAAPTEPAAASAEVDDEPKGDEPAPKKAAKKRPRRKSAKKAATKAEPKGDAKAEAKAGAKAAIKSADATATSKKSGKKRSSTRRRSKKSSG